MSKTRNRQVPAGGKAGARQPAGRPGPRQSSQARDQRQPGSAGGRAAGSKPAAGRPAGARPAGTAGARAARSQPGATAAQPATGPGAIPPAPRWLIIATLALSVIGLGISIYLTIDHLTGAVPICSSKGIINCANVTTSAESKVFGIFPVSELGLAFYAFMVVVNSPWGWRLKHPAVRWLRLGSVIVGIGFVLYLVYAELIQIGNICLWCTGVHIVTFFLFVLVVFDAVFRQAPVNPVARYGARK
jgi:uncharacterized membrane protein